MVKNRLVFLLLLVLSINFIYFYGGIVPYTLFYLMLFIPFASFVYSFILYKTCKCSQDISEMNVMEGEEVSFSYSFWNRSFLLNPYLKSNFSKTSYLVADLDGLMGFSIPPRTNLKKQYKICCKYRGVYEIGIKEVYFEDLIGIFKFVIPINHSFRLMVRPRLIKLDQLFFTKKTVDESETPSRILSQQINEVSDIRQYDTGDSLKKIHWKASSKLNQLMVKNYVNTIKSSVNLLFDLFPFDMPLEDRLATEDKMIGVLFALSYYYAQRSYPVMLTSYTNRPIEIKYNSMTTFNKQCYSFILEAEFLSEMRNDQLVDLFLHKVPQKSELFIITAVLTMELLDRLRDTQLIGFEAKVFYVIPDAYGKDNRYVYKEEILEEYENANITVIEIAIQDDIKKILEGV